MIETNLQDFHVENCENWKKFIDEEFYGLVRQTILEISEKKKAEVIFVWKVLENVLDSDQKHWI